MQIRLPERHNVANHFCPQVFLPEQFFPSLYKFYPSAVIYKVTYKAAASPDFTTAAGIV